MSTRILIGLSVLLLSACQLSPSYRFAGNSDYQTKDTAEKEFILQNAKNYNGLIAVYKQRLQYREDKETRLKLAEYYYLANDYNSSLHYLSVLLENSPSEPAYLLQAKNLSAQHQYKSAIDAINMAISSNPKSGESYNIKGIILSESGLLPQAKEAFETARNLYVKDDVINNNLAMVEIFSQRYQSAVRYLLPLYQRGYKDAKLTHNLVFALVKSGDYGYAKEIVLVENLAPYPDIFLEALADVSIQPYAPDGSVGQTVMLSGARENSESFIVPAQPSATPFIEPVVATPAKSKTVSVKPVEANEAGNDVVGLR